MENYIEKANAEVTDLTGQLQLQEEETTDTEADAKNTEYRINTVEYPSENGKAVTVSSLLTDVAAVKSRRAPKPYVFYCIMTLSVMLFTLAFAASELFSLFFSEGYPGQMVMSKLFGADGASGKNLQEIIIGQSFLELSYGEEATTAVNPLQSEPEPINNDTPASTKAPAVIINPESSTTTTQQPDSQNNNEPSPVTDIYAFDPTSVPTGMLGVMPMDLSLSDYGIGYIYNQSSSEPDIDSLASINVSTDIAGVYPSGSPIVLIIHTHGTEAYTADNVKWYGGNEEIARSTDIENNIVSIGRFIDEALNKNGIPTVHCETMFDAESYTGAYKRSADAINDYLDEYPSIQYVIDIHRDAVQRSTGEIVKPIIQTDIGTAAQVMCVVGTGAAATPVPGWQDNLALAQQLRMSLNTESAGLCRPACLRDSSYNQQLAPYSLLLEIGAAGNTLGEAKICAQKIAASLTEVISGK